MASKIRAETPRLHLVADLSNYNCTGHDHPYSLGMVLRHLFLGFIGVISGAVMATAMGDVQVQDTIIGLKCDGFQSLAQEQDACLNLAEALQERYPNRVFSTKPSTSDQVVSLTIARQNASMIAGTLSWSGEIEGQGPELTFGIKDAAIRPQDLHNFVFEIVRNTNLPF